MDSILNILSNIPTISGYSWDELKNDLDADERNILIGLAWALDSLVGFDNTSCTDSETFDKIANEISEATIEAVKDHLSSEISNVLVSFGDNHPEE